MDIIHVLLVLSAYTISCPLFVVLFVDLQFVSWHVATYSRTRGPFGMKFFRFPAPVSGLRDGVTRALASMK